MIRYSPFILGILLGPLSAMATVPEEVHGNITDSRTNEHIYGAVIQAIDNNGKVAAFTSSAHKGSFSLRLNASVDSISFRCIGYESIRLPVTYNFSDGVKMTPKDTRLNDVIVQAPDIYAKGDTLVFNVGRYANAKDNAIIDVIKRLPGIKVEDDGTIKYQGKPINKFYIDGNDFLGGQYGLATENISHKDVKSVEVMENHQPVKALEGIEFPEEAGINLKLKKDARSRWVGIAKASTGAEPLLYDGSLYAMRIAPKLQNMITLRGGNTGWNPASQISEHDFNDMFSSDYSESIWPEYISADIVSSPLNERRTRDNLSWIANAISAWKRGDTSMRLKLNYVGDRLDYSSGIVTNYFSQSIPDFIQRNSLRTRTHDISAQFNSEINNREYFLKDKFTIDAVWDNSHSSITGSSNLSQDVTRRDISTINDLKLVKRNDKQLFELISRNSFHHSPNRLAISKEDNSSQNIGITDFRSTTESKFGKLSRFWKFYVSGGIDINYHRMKTNLSGMGLLDNSETYNAFLSNIYATPQLDYERSNWRATMRVPVKWLYHRLNGQHNYINLMPQLSVRKKTSAKSEFSCALAYSLSSPQAYMNISAPILADYRNLFIGESFDKYTRHVSATLSYRYRNPLNALFVNASAAYNHSRSSVMSNQLFVENLVISTYAEKVYNTNSWTLNAGISKGIGHSKMVVGIDVNAASTTASSMRNNVVSPYRQYTAVVKPYFKGNIVRWLSLNYDAGYSVSHWKVDKVSNSHHSLNQNIFATFMPHDRVQLTLGGEHFMTRFPEGNTKHLLLFDASAVWHANSKIRLSLTANNLLNKRQYSYITYGTLSRSEHTFQIRSRDIIIAMQYRF